MDRRRYMGVSKYTLTVQTIAGATVIVNGITQSADSSGYASFNLKKGTYSYSASKTGYTSKSGSVTVIGNQTLSIVLEFNYSVGDIYYRNGVVIGVMINSSQYISLNNQSSSYISYSSALSLAISYSIQGVSGWTIPSKDEWQIIMDSLSTINNSLSSYGDRLSTSYNDAWYWTSTISSTSHYTCNLGDKSFWYDGNTAKVRVIHNI